MPLEVVQVHEGTETLQFFLHVLACEMAESDPTPVQIVGFVGDAVADTVDDFREKGPRGRESSLCHM